VRSRADARQPEVVGALGSLKLLLVVGQYFDEFPVARRCRHPATTRHGAGCRGATGTVGGIVDVAAERRVRCDLPAAARQVVCRQRLVHSVTSHHRHSAFRLNHSQLALVYCPHNQRRSQEFDLGGYKWHDIEFVLGQGDKTTT